jgi:hypothetical protein
MTRQYNYVALAAGILTIVLISASVFVPWWQFAVGNPAFATVNFSPVNFNFALFNTLLTVPILWALNIACLLTLLAGGVAMLVYSVLPNKSYSKQILGFGYKKPFYALILFIVELLILYFSATMLTGMSFPLIGSTMLALPSALAPGGISVSVVVSAAFGWTFYLAVAVVVLCIAARVFHRKVSASPPVSTSTVNLGDSPQPPATLSRGSYRKLMYVTMFRGYLYAF